jgi:hypothetical protein
MSTLMNSSTHKHIVFVVYTKVKEGLYQNEKNEFPFRLCKDFDLGLMAAIS